jgi:hypothetical protein
MRIKFDVKSRIPPDSTYFSTDTKAQRASQLWNSGGDNFQFFFFAGNIDIRSEGKTSL